MKELSFAEKYPELAAQWHPTKNGNRSPSHLSPKGGRAVAWWLYPYDDPVTGKHFDFEWESRVSSRIQYSGCPFISNRMVWPGYNDLATHYPELAAQWHPTKNGDLKPNMISPQSSKKVWWMYPYDDPKTGKHFDFEWDADCGSRVKEMNCPFLSGHRVYPGYNDLATSFPELAAQWHPTKNGSLRPTDITASSSEKVWWLLPYDDPNTGKHFDLEWQAKVQNRSSGAKCPYLTGQAVYPGFNDLATKRPELLQFWDYEKNGELKPENISAFSSKKVHWLLDMGKESFCAVGSFKTKNKINGKQVFLSNYPELTEQFHPEKNGDLSPCELSINSGKKYWWIYRYDDPSTGKHFDFEWQAQIRNRIQHPGCPYLSGRKVLKGFNDITTLAPKLAAQWHPSKNGDRNPDNTTLQSNMTVWWIYPYDDPVTGKHFDFEWQASPNSRLKYACPFIVGNRVWLGFNDLETVNPELAEQWHPTKNGDLTPSSVTSRSSKLVWWLFPYDDPHTGKHFDFEWQATIFSRTRGAGCPYLDGHSVYPGFNDIATKCPDILRYWDYDRNTDIDPTDVSIGSKRKVYWIGKKGARYCSVSCFISGNNRVAGNIKEMVGEHTASQER